MTPHALVMYIRENLLINQTIVPKLAKHKSVRIHHRKTNTVLILIKRMNITNAKNMGNQPLPRWKGQALNDPSQTSIITMFNAMKRKLTPGKEEDTPRKHLKYSVINPPTLANNVINLGNLSLQSPNKEYVEDVCYTRTTV